MATAYTYPYNPNGVLEECNIVGETHTITPANDKNYNWFIPFAAPFFGFSVTVTHVTSGKVLQRGVDYNLGLEYHVFNTRVTLRPVYGAIILVDTTLTGQFTIDYMTVGGQYAINQNKALELLANAAIDPRSTWWENVTDIPSQFPVTSHLHNVDDLVGMAEVVAAVKALSVTLADGNGKWFQALNEHLEDYNDPHHVLDMIPGDGGTSIAKATLQQAIDGTDNTGYMTALRVAQYCTANVTNLIENHVNATGNVHELVAADIDLGNVANYAMGIQNDVDTNNNMERYASLAMALYIAEKEVAKVDTSTFISRTEVTEELDTRFSTISSYPIADPDSTGSDTLTTPDFVHSALDLYGIATLLGICNTAEDRATYLAQTAVTEDMVDTTTGDIFVFDPDNLIWTQDTTRTVSDVLSINYNYYNTATGKGLKVTDISSDPVVVSVRLITQSSPGLTISASAPPTDTTGYAAGHQWFQITQ